MKKLISLSIIAVMLLSFTACVKDKENDSATTADIMKSIKAQVKLPEMADIPIDEISFHTQLKEDDIEDMSYLMSGDGISADEVLIVKMKEGINMEEVKSALETRKQIQADLFEPYAPDEMPKIEKSVIEVKGSYAIFAVTVDSTAVKKVFNDKL